MSVRPLLGLRQADGAWVYLETQDDGPDEPEDEAVVAIDNVMGPHVLQVNSLLFEKLQGLVYIFQTVDTHPTSSWLWLQRKRGGKGKQEMRMLERKKKTN